MVDGDMMYLRMILLKKRRIEKRKKLIYDY